MRHLEKKSSAHLIGIGGIGMSALARWFLAKNWAVSGSDLIGSPITQKLKKEGVKVKIGHKKANLPAGTTMVVYSAAVGSSNPEFEEAVRRGFKPMTYAETLGCLTKVYKTIAVAGSHGKSTTASLLGLTLLKAGFDPNIVIGTKLKELDGKNFRYGKSKWLVLEADEWRGAFWNYQPMIIVATNIDREHLDFYKNLGSVKASFLKFFKNIKSGGILILNRDDANLRSLESPIKKIAREKNATVVLYSIKRNAFVSKIKRAINIPGAHNVSNAAAVVAVGRALGINPKVALKVFSVYRGAWRRFEYRGRCQVSGVRCQVYDDYAHHPTEIKATLSAFKEKFPSHPLVCVYQPHQAKRLQALFKEFQSAFTDTDVLVLLPVYEVAGRDRVTSKFTSEKLAAAIKKKYPKKEIFYLADPRSIKKFLARTLMAKSYSLPPLIVMMGAGDVVNYTPLLLGSKNKKAR